MFPAGIVLALPSLASPAGETTGGWGEAVVGREDWLPGAIAALGIFLITAVLLRRWVKKSRQNQEIARTPVRERREQIVRHSAERESLDRLMVEVQELTRVCAAQIENRATKLEHLIELADRRLCELAEACENAPRRPEREYPGERQRSPERREPVGVAHGNGRDWSSEGDPGRDSPMATGDHLSRRVHELSQMGLKSIEIARQLDEQVGKVELILALRDAS